MDPRDQTFMTIHSKFKQFHFPGFLLRILDASSRSFRPSLQPYSSAETGNRGVLCSLSGSRAALGVRVSPTNLADSGSDSGRCKTIRHAGLTCSHRSQSGCQRSIRLGIILIFWAIHQTRRGPRQIML